MVIFSDNESGLLTVAKYLNSLFQMPNEPLYKAAQKEYILTLILEWVDLTENAIHWYDNEFIPALGTIPKKAIIKGQIFIIPMAL
jgi:hypothetical protein